MTQVETLLRRTAPALILLSTLLAGAPRAVAAGAAEPVAVKVGDPAVDGSFIKPFKNAWNVIRFKPDGTPVVVGTWTDDVEIAQEKGRTVLKRVQHEKLPRGNFVMTNVVDQKTLAPILSDISNDKGYHMRLEFVDPTHVKTEHVGAPVGSKPGEPVKKEDLEIPMPVYDFLGGTYGMLLVAFPLHEGYAAKLPIFLDEGNKIDWLTFHVGAKESVPAGPGKKVDAYRVTTEQGGFKMIFHLTKEPPHVIRLEETGPTGVRTVFEMM